MLKGNLQKNDIGKQSSGSSTSESVEELQEISGSDGERTESFASTMKHDDDSGIQSAIITSSASDEELKEENQNKIEKPQKADVATQYDIKNDEEKPSTSRAAAAASAAASASVVSHSREKPPSNVTKKLKFDFSASGSDDDDDVYYDETYLARLLDTEVSEDVAPRAASTETIENERRRFAYPPDFSDSDSSELNLFEMPSVQPELMADDIDDDDIDDDDDDDNSSNNDLLSDDDALNYTDDDTNNDTANATVETTVKAILNKPKPPYNRNWTQMLMRRESGLFREASYMLDYFANRLTIERMQLSHCLSKHTGCVNCVNFNNTGELLVTGSDDTRIVIWNWSKGKPLYTFKSGHSQNIFQTKFLNHNYPLEIISAGRDGQIRHANVPGPGGGKPHNSLIYKHRGAVHKIVVCPQSSQEIISVGEDGKILGYDLRGGGNIGMGSAVTGTNDRRVHLFSVSHNPFAPEICVCGSDSNVRVYDKRNMSKTVYTMCPSTVQDSASQVTCCVYNYNGKEILASYTSDSIYLLDNTNYKEGSYLHRYSGHYNRRTIKGVNFFGPKSEYVISGSDCGNIFFWDKDTEAIINFLPGDSKGVVNCLESHPTVPILATSGLECTVKIWSPTKETYPPDLANLEDTVKQNVRRALNINKPYGDTRIQNFLRQFLRRSDHFDDDDDDDDDDNDNSSEVEMVWSNDNSSSNTDDEYPRIENMQCRTQ